jgi:hypothetical protein
MNPLCRHILPAGRHCTQPAVRSTLYCRHHQVIKRALTQVEPKPDPYGIYTPLPFVFPEDRAALQINFMLIAQALNDQSINIQMANTFNRIFRSCEINLRNGLLHETDRDKPQKQAQRRNPNEKWLTDDDDSEPQRDPRGEMVRSVVLTPEGEEIAQLRELWEKGEDETHGEDCPCQNCAQQFRGAAPEKHHLDCKCAICEETTVPAPAVSDQDKIELSSRPKRSEVEGPAVPQSATTMSTPSLTPAPAAARPCPDPAKGVESEEPATHNAEAVPCNEHQEEIEKNRQAAHEAWIARYADIPSAKPAPSWSEKQDRKPAQMRAESSVTSPPLAVASPQ